MKVNATEKSAPAKFIQRLFCLGNKFRQDIISGTSACVTDGTGNDTHSNATSSSTSSFSSFNEEIKRSRTRKPTFLTNYTLLESLQIISANTLKSEIGVRSYAGFSKRGCCASEPNKKNQDAMIMMEDDATASLILVCIDGHGQYGDLVAQFIKRKLEEKLCKHPNFMDNLKLAISETISVIEKLLYEDGALNCDYSGAAVNIAVIRNFHITVANVGDCRTMMVTRLSNNKLKSIPISVDHKPETESEKERILAAGGRVFPITYPDGIVGPHRVWLGDVDAPGLAMSRSIGDKIVHSVGVSSEPEFFEWDLKSEDCALVVATDGLWTVFSDDEVGLKAMSCREPASTVSLLLRETHNRWIRSGDSVDDTTVCVVYFQGR